MHTAALLTSGLALVGSALANTAYQVLWDNGEWADPSIFHDVNGNGYYYIYATGASGPNVRMARSVDNAKSFQDITADISKDPLPKLGGWATSPPTTAQVWAPDVIRLPSGKYVMYYSAISESATTFPVRHCVGAATSDSPEGPFTPIEQALACPLEDGGAIDPNGFIDTDGSIYVIYQVCGNAMGKGGTWIMAQKLLSDGVTLDPSSGPVKLFESAEIDGNNVEAPSVTKRGDTYFCGFSSNNWNSSFYDTSYAVSHAIQSTYTKQGPPIAPLLTSNTKDGNSGKDLYGPGGADFLDGEDLMVFHAWAGTPGDGYRHVWIANVSFDPDQESITLL